MEGAGGAHLLIAGYGRLRLQVDQEAGDVRGPAHELAVERVAYVPNLRQHNLLLVKKLTQSFDAPMQFYPATFAFLPRRQGQHSYFDLLDWNVVS